MKTTTNPRQTIERRIVMAAFDGLIRAGYVVAIDYGDGPERRTTDREAFAAQLQACDEEWIHAYARGSRRIAGSVFLVYGNDDGTTVISDYSMSLEPALQEAIDLADRIAGGAL